jgi:hypothetical protein
MWTDPTGQFVPLILAYARCVAQCSVTDAAIAYVTGDKCADAGSVLGDCATSCLNPLNWFNFSKLGAAARQGSMVFEKMKQGNNIAKNKQARDALREAEKILGKSIDRKQAHEEISKAGLDSFEDIRNALLDRFR